VNLKKSDYINWGSNQIQFVIPKGAESGKISVTVYNQKSNEVSFYVYEKGTVQDMDGNTYNTIKIGRQWWMAENLKVTKYNNGEAIFEEKDPDKWTVLTKGAMCYYDNNLEKLAVYGRLYNWYALKDPRGLAPKGWHIPTDEEWSELYEYLGGAGLAGGKLKEKGTGHWLTPNMGAIDVIDFKALPGGCRYKEGTYMSISQSGFWWSSSTNSFGNVGYYSLRHNYPTIDWHGFDMEGGCSIRCVKN
jgi:uncharacterized protein (TIGR02145 family)